MVSTQPVDLEPHVACIDANAPLLPNPAQGAAPTAAARTPPRGARLLDAASFTAALRASVDPYAPPLLGGRATPDQIVTTDGQRWS